MLKVVFVTNCFNHHQSSLSDAISRIEDIQFYFIETSPMTDERKKMGWGFGEKPKYVISAYESDKNKAQCLHLIDEADFAIIGSAPDSYIKSRHRCGKFIFRYSERFYKNGFPVWQLPIRYVKNYLRFGKYKNDYLLCASAYTSADAAITRSFLGKAYKWGYFLPVRDYNFSELFAEKQKNNCICILWAGRMIDLKHPEVPVLLAEKLKSEHIDFYLNIIGSGEMENTLSEMIREKELSDCVRMLGVKKPEEVRDFMEKSDIYLFTSDFGEGWGAVLNESMNAGCAVVASHAIGSVPFLIDNWENGVIYKNGDIDELYKIVKKLIFNSDLRRKIGSAAYRSMTDIWNAETAASRLIDLYYDLKDKGYSDRFLSGPCSKAPILKNEWYIND